MSQMKALPQECLLQVAEFLDGHNLAYLMETCVEWRNVILNNEKARQQHTGANLFHKLCPHRFRHISGSKNGFLQDRRNGCDYRYVLLDRTEERDGSLVFVRIHEPLPPGHRAVWISLQSFFYHTIVLYPITPTVTHHLVERGEEEEAARQEKSVPSGSRLVASLVRRHLLHTLISTQHFWVQIHIWEIENGVNDPERIRRVSLVEHIDHILYEFALPYLEAVDAERRGGWLVHPIKPTLSEALLSCVWFVAAVANRAHQPDVNHWANRCISYDMDIHPRFFLYCLPYVIKHRDDPHIQHMMPFSTV